MMATDLPLLAGHIEILVCLCGHDGSELVGGRSEMFADVLTHLVKAPREALVQHFAIHITIKITNYDHLLFNRFFSSSTNT